MELSAESSSHLLNQFKAVHQRDGLTVRYVAKQVVCKVSAGAILKTCGFVPRRRRCGEQGKTTRSIF